MKCTDFPISYDKKLFNGCFKRNDEDEYFCQIDQKAKASRKVVDVDKKGIEQDNPEKSNKVDHLGIWRDSCPKHAGKNMSPSNDSYNETIKNLD